MWLRRLLAGIFAAGALCACAPDKNAPQAAKVAPAKELFVDATESSGIRFQHFNGRNGQFYYPEIIGSGVAVLDYNNDGKLDILVLQGVSLEPAHDAKAATEPCTARLYRNDLVVNPDGTRNLKYTDVTEASGLCSHGYGMGIAIGDFNNDGCIDIFITHFGAPNQLFRNNCDGTFTDVTRKAGVAGNGHWGSSATFVDYDRDGFLDLYVANYVDYKTENNKKCYAGTSARDYCAPSTYKPAPGILYHNRGAGYLEDRSGETGVAAPSIPFTGFGTVFFDYDNDGWLDIAATNGAVHLIEELKTPQDPYPLQQRKQLFHNLGNGRFEETTASAGQAFQLVEVGRGLAAAESRACGSTAPVTT